ncbi:type II toxin-antitoxin system RelE family toxin [Acetobacter cibinongensis]|uniref:Uncharacterized protein n=1 Tax=Acetobacter cibinongensis TaxID=146475 RepID=A0A0D6N6H2_9PROT|nr:hypothetical protein [Acetobacter cibinongensis]GAN61564.1 hypothetical protein Abci_038_007 [Acetobacter cibinongensis]GBQ14660.1 hypothetical protein AA0482_0977 [Acetobacter cibinongensis NRIC 0482]GEL60148.1 hypothetical protein ACI01nite_27500 [Acetobacter cibinongensis]
MSRYTLQFDPRALKEWRSLDRTIQAQFKKVLAIGERDKSRAYAQAGKRL